MLKFPINIGNSNFRKEATDLKDLNSVNVQKLIAQ